jgi:two-component system phosphate regulon sensor histidine kinase PhoR
LEHRKAVTPSPLAQLDSQTLLDQLSSGALVVDQHGKIIYGNPVFCALASQNANQLTGLSITDFIQLPPKSDCALCMGATTNEQRDSEAFPSAFHGGFLQVAPNGHETPETLRVKIKHSRLGADWILCLIDPFSEDTTLTQAHSDFVSTVSHEFRTPLTSIKGFADTLLSYGAQLPDEEKRRFINIIKDQADRLIRLVENLLTASKLGASRVDMSYRPIPLQRLLDKVVHSVQAKVQLKTRQDRRFEVKINPPSLEVWADSDRLEQVLLNLIDNAVKYSPASGVVRVQAEFLPEDDNWVRIRVMDEGAGIPQDLLPKIFTKFYRVESPLKQEVEGTGLGLYITKSLTTAMGGQITAESEEGTGSTFTVTLPAATPQRQAAYRRTLYASQEDE